MADDLSPWQRAAQIFDELVGLPDAEQEQALEEMNLDEALESEVRSLLSADREDAGLLDQPEQLALGLAAAEEQLGPVGHVFGDPDADPTWTDGDERKPGPGSPFIGRRIGKWTLMEEIGRGGSSLVFKARWSEDGFDQVAALKLLTLGALGTDHGRFFSRERDMLVRLKHPHIATLLDGGMAEDGTPFLVTELVDGKPLDEHCTDHDLGLDDRLDLFLQVCDTVAYAHSRLIVHRDLKPSNIFADSEGRIRLLDFGIAKLLDDQKEATKSVRSFTPAYASPEQWAGEPATTATDVYGLGLVLHVLLTDQSPTLPGGFGTAAGESLAPPSQLSDEKRIDRDLDSIVAHAVRADAADRYPDARALADDLRRWRAGHPTLARPTGPIERATKFVRRHLLPTAAVGLAALSLVALAVVSTWQQRQTAKARDQAQAESLIAKKESETARATIELLQDFLSSANAREKGHELTVVELLEAFEPRLATIEDQEIQSTLLHTYADTYLSLGIFEEARAFAEQSIDLRRELFGPDHEKTLLASTDLSLVLFNQGALAEAEPLSEQVLADARRALGERHEVTLDAIDNRALILAAQGNLPEAEKLYEEVWTLRREVLGEDDPRTTLSLNGFAITVMRLGRPDEAQPLLEKALEKIRQARGDDHFETLTAMNNLAYCHTLKGDFVSAIPTFRDLARRLAKTLGPEHPRALASESNLAVILLRAGQPDESATVLGPLVGRFEKALGAEHPDTVGAMVNYAAVLRRLERYEEAERLGRRAYEGQLKNFGEEHSQTLSAMSNLATTLGELGRYQEMESLLRRAIAARTRMIGADKAQTLGARAFLASGLRLQRRYKEAQQESRDALSIAMENLDSCAPEVLDLTTESARASIHLNQKGDAITLLKQCHERCREARDVKDPQIATLQELLESLDG